MGRHGEGWHNAAESFYGTPAWNVSLISLAPESAPQHLTTTSATGPSRREMARPYGPTRS